MNHSSESRNFDPYPGRTLRGALKSKSSPRTRSGLDASTAEGLTEKSGEVFSLDILSPRISAMAHQPYSRLNGRSNDVSPSL